MAAVSKPAPPSPDCRVCNGSGEDEYGRRCVCTYNQDRANPGTLSASIPLPHEPASYLWAVGELGTARSWWPRGYSGYGGFATPAEFCRQVARSAGPEHRIAVRLVNDQLVTIRPKRSV